MYKHHTYTTAVRRRMHCCIRWNLFQAIFLSFFSSTCSSTGDRIHRFVVGSLRFLATDESCTSIYMYVWNVYFVVLLYVVRSVCCIREARVVQHVMEVCGHNRAVKIRLSVTLFTCWDTPIAYHLLLGKPRRFNIYHHRIIHAYILVLYKIPLHVPGLHQPWKTTPFLFIPSPHCTYIVLHNIPLHVPGLQQPDVGVSVHQSVPLYSST